MTESHDENRYKVLDGLRALAILLVVATHVAYPMHKETSQDLTMLGTEFLTWFFMNGWVGVHLFFVLSGFLITGQLLKVGRLPREKQGEGIKDYLKRRFCRIIPIYYVMLTIALYVRIKLDPPDSWLWVTQEYLRHIFFLNDYYVSWIKLLFWSLAVEAKFYLVAPIIVLALLKLSPKNIGLSLLVLMAGLLLIKIWTFHHLPLPINQFSYFTQIRSPFHMALDSLIMGVICQFIWSSAKGRAWLSQPLCSNLLFFTGSALFIALTAFTKPYFYFETARISLTLFYCTYYFTAMSLAFGMMLLGLMGRSYGYKIFENIIFKGIALISYSLYLVHTSVITYMGQKAEIILGSATPGFSLWLLTFMLTLLVSIPLSATLYYFIEKPFIDWSKRKRSAITP